MRFCGTGTRLYCDRAELDGEDECGTIGNGIRD